MIQAQFEDPIHDHRCRGLRMGMVRGRQVLSPGENVRLNSMFPRIETASVHPFSTTRFRDMPQRFCLLRDRKAVMSYFLIRVFRRDTSHTDNS